MNRSILVFGQYSFGHFVARDLNENYMNTPLKGRGS